MIEKWIKLNASPRCYGARDNLYSAFTITNKGVLLSMKLVRLNGSITCDTNNEHGWNYWGCVDFKGNHMYMSVIITNATNQPVFPDNPYFISAPKTYNIPGYSVFSPDIIFPKLLKPRSMVIGQEYRIWFGQDMANLGENNNGGLVCVDVLGLYE